MLHCLCSAETWQLFIQLQQKMIKQIPSEYVAQSMQTVQTSPPSGSKPQWNLNKLITKERVAINFIPRRNLLAIFLSK